ncbi:MAG: RnfABCDGE type electron transport complex subunit D [Verrucomicrobia bacterium]|nr:RnfABCDGE type electron transport complex subunit D [Verrucomicrobiota bacterium]
MLSVSSSPHVRAREDAGRIMRDVIIALVPALVASYFFFGIAGIMLTAIACIAALATEIALLAWRGRKVDHAAVYSALVTAVLMTFCVSPLVPWWMVVVGAVVAIGIGKHAFGGLGHNIFNPALVGRAFLMSAYMVPMTTWKLPDGISGATPLAHMKIGAYDKLPSLWHLALGDIGGCIGETSAILLLAGAAYLLVRRVITWHVPVAYLGALAVFVWIFGGTTKGGAGLDVHVFNGLGPMNLGAIPVHLLAGGVILGACFMATDYVSSPMTPKGMIIFGVGCGILTGVIRIFGGYPEGTSYAILLMNMTVPLIDRATMPRLFGARRLMKKKGAA